LHQPSEPLSNGNSRFGLHDVFAGPEGLRAGWGLLLFVVVWMLLRMLLHPLIRSLAPGIQDTAQPMTPLYVIVAEASSLACVAASTWLMARIEGRRFRHYGLEDNRPGRRLAMGAAWGAVLLSTLVLCLRVAGALAFDGWQLSAWDATTYAVAWLFGFLLVGLFEELLFRGYPQYTLARGISGICHQLGLRHCTAIGFWTAALLTSCFFGYVHRSNSGESSVGLISAGLIALVFCVSIWRTGSLWWAIGFHAAWDWMESFFYGVGNSGTLIRGQLITSHPVGRATISGGATGPEGSTLVLPVILLSACVVFLTLPRTGANNRASTSMGTAHGDSTLD
jgi:uncharacterized protein